MELPAKSRHDLEQSLHVLPFRVEVHNAGAKYVAPVHDGVRHERFAAALNPIEQCLVQFVEVPLGRLLPQRGPQILGHVPECRDAEILRHKLQRGMRAHPASHRPRQEDVV